MFRMLPPTVVESQVCPYWFLQMQCTSMRTDRYKYCGMVHPEFIDYDVSEFSEAERWCQDPNLTRGQLHWMVNVQRGRFFAKHNWCKWEHKCECAAVAAQAVPRACEEGGQLTHSNPTLVLTLILNLIRI